MLLDTRHHHFDVRTLIVGISRAEHGDFVHVPTVAQELSLMREVRESPPPPAAVIDEPGEPQELPADSEEES